MDRKYRSKKIVDLSEQELITLGFLGDNALPGVRDKVQRVRADPVRLGSSVCVPFQP